MKKIALYRTLSRVESMIGVMLALLIPVAAIGGAGFATLAATMLR